MSRSLATNLRHQSRKSYREVRLSLKFKIKKKKKKKSFSSKLGSHDFEFEKPIL